MKRKEEKKRKEKEKKVKIGGHEWMVENFYFKKLSEIRFELKK